MNKTRTLILVLTAALLSLTIATEHASAARPLDDGEPVGTSTGPLETGPELKVVVFGRGTVRGSGFNCAQTCWRTFHKGDAINLSAQEAPGYHFSGWQGACRAPQNRSCTVYAGYVSAVTAVFALDIPVKALSATPGIGINNGFTRRKVVVVFDVGATSVVAYELRQNGVPLERWTSSPFSGRSTRTIWIDDGIPAGTYEIGLKITTGVQVKSFHGSVVLPSLP